jgi:hypothetical protein
MPNKVKKSAAKYVVVDTKYGTSQRFDDALSVGVHMWGLDLKRYAVYQLQASLPCDIVSLTAELKQRELAQFQ